MPLAEEEEEEIDTRLVKEEEVACRNLLTTTYKWELWYKGEEKRNPEF